MVKTFRYRENICEIGRAGGCCSNPEHPDQIGRVGMFAITKMGFSETTNLVNSCATLYIFFK